ncbi:hypothetical protein CYMTET_29041 [Cymbomonas tetramitiformis]|uniref:Fibrinogen C-terminal domain-containing protein n=1 Tax=Cymbomonas tetramitiformis TaxID=36881 RepID=A0AAE0KVC3_9CHLO|nr:hypothetical protein CYMTET_29041 [Cymbomonas tetramitiformis]
MFKYVRSGATWESYPGKYCYSRASYTYSTQSTTSTDSNYDTYWFIPGVASDTILQSCKQHREAGYTTDGQYFIRPSGLGTDTIVVSCDQSTDGGGWTIVGAYTGANAESVLTATDTTNGNPLSYQHYSMQRKFKSEISADSIESLFKSSSGVYIKVNKPMFGTNKELADETLFTCPFACSTSSTSCPCGFVDCSCATCTTLAYSELNPSCMENTLSYCAGTGVSESACDIYNNARVQVQPITASSGGALTGGNLPSVGGVSVSLTIPANALASDVTMSIAETDPDGLSMPTDPKASASSQGEQRPAHKSS